MPADGGICRDIEDLLNARSTEGLPDYGLPDLSELSEGPDLPVRLAELVEDCLRAFEPRLANVRVSPGQGTAHGQIVLRVEADLVAPPPPSRLDLAVLVGPSGVYRLTFWE
jgi:type VI secretion system lysozyme-like protein